jgi:hypothetical protein
MYYALVNGDRKPPAPRLEGICPSCRTPVTPKCGNVKTWHWAHKNVGECDPWAESLTEWHLAWQRGLLNSAVEVVMENHRADIVGNNSTVVELQHSPIKAEDIAARETFYGNMVWLFDATERFRFIDSGDRVFFSLGRAERHSPIRGCRKPVFLDFGDTVIQVEFLTDDLDRFSGFGLPRTREWFRQQYLSEVLGDGEIVEPPVRAEVPFLHWEGNSCPYRKMMASTRWIDPATHTELLIDTNATYIPVNYGWNLPGGGSKPVKEMIIENMPQLANGWTVSEIHDLTKWLSARAVILGGRLRLIPAKLEAMERFAAKESPSQVLDRIRGHIAAGRVPILDDTVLDKVYDLVMLPGWDPSRRWQPRNSYGTNWR